MDILQAKKFVSQILSDLVIENFYAYHFAFFREIEIMENSITIFI